MSRDHWPTLLLSFALSLAWAGLCHLAAGPTLGLYLAATVAVAVLVPPLVLLDDVAARQFTRGAAVVDAAAVVWLLSLTPTGTSLWQWLQAYLLLATCAFAAGASAAFLARVGFSRPIAAGVTTLGALAWIGWPVWLAPHLAALPGTLHYLVLLHPPLALNGLLTHLGIWTEQGLMYRLTTLNQDVPYALPPTMAASLLFHAAWGLGLILLAPHLESDAGPSTPADAPTNF